MNTEFIALVVKDIIGVIYAPHKTFKKIAENPKYLAILIIIALFVALQIVYNYDYYSKVNVEQTLPPIGQLSDFTTTNATQWITTSGTIVTKNSENYINQTYYGNNSLQLTLLNSNNLSAAIEQFGYTADCSSNGFTELNININQISPNIAPQTGILTLYTTDTTSNYFTIDITSMLTTNPGEWNNITIPVGTLEWQSTGTPDWSKITGLQLTLTYAQTSDITILLQGIFFRGQYMTNLNLFGTGTLMGYLTFSIVLQVLAQWIILAAVAYIIIKGLKGTNVVWRNLFVTIGFTLIALVITAVLFCLISFTLQTVYYPYDLIHGVVDYSPIIDAVSPSSQVAYESITVATNTYIVLNYIVNLMMFVIQIVYITFAVKAITGVSLIKNALTFDAETTEQAVNDGSVSEFSYKKSILVAICTVLVSAVVIFLLQYIGIL
ncbi:MAG: hypothetical protein FWH37_02425 [Candidatus Bathyarchaeota archaeon]|nr:hypothetical protein [Candidatus Termiticorpusculum sp.]